MKKQSVLSVIVEAKDLCSYVLQASNKMPKNVRFTLSVRMQNLCFDVLENLIKANKMSLKGEAAEHRLRYQRRAGVYLELLDYFTLIAREQACITPKQHENICIHLAETKKLLGGWINSDKKRKS